MKIVDWRDMLGGPAEASAPARSEAFSPARSVALTIGVFDSLHIGHQRLIRAVVSNQFTALPAVCTFTNNPVETLGTRPAQGSILSFSQKMAKLEALGIALVVLIDFSAEISKLTGKSFLDLLASRLDIKKLVVGYNFHMGQRRDTGVGELIEMLAGSGIELEVVPATFYKDEVVSSSRIREAILQGSFDDVRGMLKDDFRLDLKGITIVREGGSSRIRSSEIKQVLPKQGEYRVLFCTGKDGQHGRLVLLEDELCWHENISGDEIEIRF